MLPLHFTLEVCGLEREVTFCKQSQDSTPVHLLNLPCSCFFFLNNQCLQGWGVGWRSLQDVGSVGIGELVKEMLPQLLLLLLRLQYQVAESPAT